MHAFVIGVAGARSTASLDRAPVRETGIISDLDPLAGWLSFTDGSIHWLPSSADVSALRIGDEVTIVYERGHAGRAVS
jgi:hypothetical protein